MLTSNNSNFKGNVEDQQRNKCLVKGENEKGIVMLCYKTLLQRSHPVATNLGSAQAHP